MEKLSSISRFQQRRNIVLKGFDPISAYGFTQIPNFLLNDTTLSSNAKVVYAKLLSYAWHNDRVFPGQDRMSKELGTSRPTVTKAISELQKRGLLILERRGQGKTNIYTLHHTVQGRK